MQSLVDPVWVMNTAARFFGQHNSNVLPIEAVLDRNVWLVTVSIGLMNKKTKQIRINANTGKILGYS